MKVFCLESEWVDNNLKENWTVRPALDFMQSVLKKDGFIYQYKPIPTIDSFFFYMDELVKRKYKSYDVLYLGLHGSKGKIHFAKQKELSLEEIATRYEGKLTGKYIHFGSCSTLKVEDEVLAAFKKQTGAQYISGYTTKVDFVDGTMLDMGLFYQLIDLTRRGHVEKRMSDNYADLIDRLGFKFY